MTAEEARLTACWLADYEATRAQILRGLNRSVYARKLTCDALEVICPLGYAKARERGADPMEAVRAGLEGLGTSAQDAIDDLDNAWRS